jgi:hypothetical protein
MKTRARRFLIRIASVGLLSLAGVAWAAPPQLFTAPRGPVNDHVPDFVRSGATAVRFNSDEMLNLSVGEEVELTLPNARRHTFVFELRQDHGNGIYSWVGKHKTRGNNNRAIVTTGPTGSFGVFYTPDGEYRLIPGEGHDWLVDMTAEAPPRINLGDDALTPPAPKPPEKSTQNVIYAPETMMRVPGVNSVAVSASTPAPTYVVDVMFVYTNGLAANLGSNLMTRFYFLITTANTAYSDSEVAIVVRLVGTMMVTYSDATSDSTALNAISPSQGGFDAGTFGGVETARTANGADLVAFLRNGSSFGGSGLAWVGSATPNTMPTYMYSVTTGCVLGCESVLIHEMGHNMGNAHDRSTASWQAGGTASPPIGAYSYSFGYAFCKSGALTCNPTIPPGSGGCSSQPECSTNDASNFSDIMAYFQGSTTELLKFSNPNVNCATPSGDGVPRPCGVNEALSTSANTALSMNNNRAALSAVKGAAITAPQPVAGSLQFSGTAFAAAESAGTLSFTVSRLGGKDGAVSASYATSNGTALAGTHYTASSGNVSWTDQDNANKTINVPLIANGPDANALVFNLTLSSPTGGSFLGVPPTAAGIIVEPWPPGGTFPSGFVTPDGSAGAWTLATDRVYEGTYSLRSAQVYGSLSGPTYTNSDVSYAGTFVNGIVGFAYNVSSWANPGYITYGLLEFSVDGAVVMSDAGETGWKYYAYSLTAGSHTLRWRFKNAMPSACNGGWNPPAPGGANCADRAWIDAVALPLAGPPPAPAITSVISRKTHTSGILPTNYDVSVNPATALNGSVSVEPRMIETGHKLIFTFDQSISSTGTVTALDAGANPVGSVSSSIGGSAVTVTLTGVPDNQRLTVNIPNVNGSGTTRSASVGFLVGDVNGSLAVTAADILVTKGRLAQTLSASNFTSDVDLNKSINATDLAAVKANAGRSIP